MDIWICPTCKEENKDYEQYCRKCGTWLLSTTHPAKKVQKSNSSSYPNKKIQRNHMSSPNSNGFKTFYIIEAVFILIVCFITLMGDNLSNSIFAGFLMFSGLVLLGTSIILTIVQLITKNLGRNKKGIRNHYFLALGLLIISLFLANTNSAPASTQVTNNFLTLEQYQSASLRLDYRDLTRNADSMYKDKMVQFKGTVYHLVDGKQNYVMIDVTDDSKSPYKEVISVSRKDNSGTLLVGDTVDVYGIVKGTQKTTTFIGTESIVPSIESHYIILTSE